MVRIARPGLIRAIQTYSKTNVLATPQIIALDNNEANFVSAEKIPVPQVTAVQGAGTSTSVTKESVELSIKIKPQINKMSNFVKLDVEAKISSIQNQSGVQQCGSVARACIVKESRSAPRPRHWIIKLGAGQCVGAIRATYDQDLATGQQGRRMKIAWCVQRTRGAPIPR